MSLLEHSVFGKMWDENVRIDAMWPVPAVEAPETLLEAFDMLDALPEALQPLVARWQPDEIEPLFAGDDYEAREAWGELFAAMFRAETSGFITAVSTPVMTKTSETSSSFSWGHWHTGIVFGATAEEAMNAALAWGAERYAADMAKEPA